MTTRPGGSAAGAEDGGVARSEAGDGGDNPRFRATLLRVLLVQAATLALLWFLQAVYHA